MNLFKSKTLERKYDDSFIEVAPGGWSCCCCCCCWWVQEVEGESTTTVTQDTL